MSSGSNDDYLVRVQAEIRADADLARARTPLPRRDPPVELLRAQGTDGIERERLDDALDDLTGTHYIAFIHHAFRALLKRAPDDAGCTAQLRVLANGASQAEVLGNLRWSPEGRRVGARVRGLLPRYALAKIVRVPVLGYCVEWGIAVAALPVLMRHQRAADTSVAARFATMADTQRERDGRLQELGKSVAELPANLDQRVAEIGTQIRGALRHLVILEQRATAMEARSSTLAHGDGERAREIADLRHSVHTTNHWVVSLQRSLGMIEDAAQEQRLRAEQLAVAAHESTGAAATQHARHSLWANELATQLPAASIVLDLGSGDGTWLDALTAHGVAARGIEANSVWVARAQARGVQIAHGDPQDALARCPDASLGGLVLAADTLSASNVGIAELLVHAQRTLQAGGCLLLRLESGMMRVTRDSALLLDPAHWAAILRGAGFALVSELNCAGATALLARRA
ncbi:MAG: methionine biosynthesis protein MetW [Dokdonella sp.]